MKATIGRGAIVLCALVFGLIAFSAQPSIAFTLLSPFQSSDKESKQSQSEGLSTSGSETAAEATALETEKPLVPAAHYVATAYSLRGRTASGRMVSRGLIAADPRVLPLGSRVRLEHPGYSGEYVVADTGGMIRGRRIDIWTPSSREAMRFGRRTVKLTVLSYPARKARRSTKG